MKVDVTNRLSFSASRPNGVPARRQRQPSHHRCEGKGELEIAYYPDSSDTITLTAHGDHGSGNGESYYETAVVVLTLAEFEEIASKVCGRRTKLVDATAVQRVQSLLENASASLKTLLSGPCGKPASRNYAR